MFEWVTWWFDSRNYMPHGHCYLWQPSVLWLNVGSDLAIAAAYMAIPAVIGRVARGRAREFRFGWLALLFAAFIFLCGTTHLMDAYTAWVPQYRVAGLLKGATAIVSVGTALALLKVMPGVLTLRTPQQLQLEVAERTRELEAANRRLQEEIEARRASEQALEESQRLLRLSDQRKDEFLASLSHELRNPLAPVRNSLAILEELSHPDPVFRRARDIMTRQIAQMVRLVDDLLDIGRISTGRITLHVEPLVLQDTVQRALETVAPLLEHAGHAVVVEQPHEPVQLDGDATRLTQVFTNLLTNSVKYTTPPGEIHVRMSVHSAAHPTEIRVEVSDNGMGIAPADLPRIFDMFVQLNPARAAPGSGLGIGLALSRRFVELHGGRLEAHSEGLGRGSRFTVFLPTAPTWSHGPPP